MALPPDRAVLSAWRELAGAGASDPVAITTLHTAHGSAVYRLDGAARGGAAVVAKRQWRANVLREAAVYEQVVPRLPAGGIGCLGTVDDPDERFAWLFLEAAGGAPYLADRDDHRRLAGRWLGDLHVLGPAAAERVDLPARTLDPYRDWLSTAQERLARATADPALDGADRKELERLLARSDTVGSHWDELVAACAAAPTALVHGDFVPRNLLVAAGGRQMRLIALDWSDAGIGPPMLDLAQSPLPSTGFCANPELRAYARAASERGVELPDAERMGEIATVLRAVAATSWDAPGLASEWPQRPLKKMRFYEATLAHALRELGWT